MQCSAGMSSSPSYFIQPYSVTRPPTRHTARTVLSQYSSQWRGRARCGHAETDRTAGGERAGLVSP